MFKNDVNIGDKFTRLEVVGWMLSPSFEGRMLKHYICKCDCGNLVKTTFSRLKNNENKSCGCIRGHVQIKNRKAYGNNSTRNAIISVYKKRAKKKLLTFSLSEPELLGLFEGKCFYCGDIPWRIASYGDTVNSFIYNGIDRLDNTLGYTAENTVSCCSTCNRAKLDSTVEEFLTQIENIYTRIETIKLERDLS